MIELEKKMKEAEQFTGEKDCYIHVEMKDGECERLVSGSLLGMIHGLCGIIDKLSEHTGESFDDTLIAIQSWHYVAIGGTKDD